MKWFIYWDEKIEHNNAEITAKIKQADIGSNWSNTIVYIRSGAYMFSTESGDYASHLIIHHHISEALTLSRWNYQIKRDSELGAPPPRPPLRASIRKKYKHHGNSYVWNWPLQTPTYIVKRVWGGKVKIISIMCVIVDLWISRVINVNFYQIWVHATVIFSGI